MFGEQYAAFVAVIVLWCMIINHGRKLKEKIDTKLRTQYTLYMLYTNYVMCARRISHIINAMHVKRVYLRKILVSPWENFLASHLL